MVFRNFRFQVIARVLVLAVALGLLIWCLFEGLYLRSAYIGFAVTILIIEFIRYVDRINHEVTTFLLALSQHDFTSVFPEKGKGKSFYELHQALNHITGLFRAISSQKEIQHRYLEMLVQHIRVGIMSFKEDESIHLANDAALRMLRRKVIGNLRTLEAVDPGLVSVLREIRSGETRLVNMTIDQETLSLSIHASEFRLETTYYKLISLQDIRNELDAREVESWQKLIRVLTHEIMNSIAPISSLSDTLHKLVERNRSVIDGGLYDPLSQGLNAIKIRSDGLQGFTEAYRKLTRVPQPHFKLVDIREVVRRVISLIQPVVDSHQISLVVKGDSLMVDLDPELIEHVLINLVQNAIDAVMGSQERHIAISIYRKGEAVLVEITDNGIGVPTDIIDKVFIPFFTTKPGGSGIGLALSKQIVQLHRGSLRVTSSTGGGTTFTITLPDR